MAKIVLSSKNRGKQREFGRLILPAKTGIELVMPDDDFEPPPETGQTYEENAIIKAVAAAKHHRLPALGEDSGIGLVAMNGAPGVFSARFAALPLEVREGLVRGETWAREAAARFEVVASPTSQENNQLLLDWLARTPSASRQAYYVAHIVLVDVYGNVKFKAVGQVDGHVLEGPRGLLGFGYDPIMSFDEFPGRSVAELTDAEKDGVSHRARALEALYTELFERVLRKIQLTTDS